MKLYAPKYYKDFVCIADRCKHSCCIGWEIDVDAVTMEKYRALSGDCGERIMESIDPLESPHFRLTAADRCPHLDGRGLCRIISSLGEGYLCDICREHPRFYHVTARGREVGLGISCEEACRIILGSDGYREMTVIGEDNEEADAEFDSVAEREKVFSILSDSDIPYAERLCAIAKEYSASPTRLTDVEWRSILDGLEYLDSGARVLFMSYSSDVRTPKAAEKVLERALAYFIYRHASPAENAEEFRASIGFALFAERLLCSISSADNIFDRARIISEEIEYSEENSDALKTEFLF